VRLGASDTAATEGGVSAAVALEKIRYASDLSPEVRAAIDPHLAKWAFLIPGWCHGVDVRWDDDDTTGALVVTVHYEYRDADLIVLPNFLTHLEHRQRQLVHELMHLLLAPLTAVAEALRDALVKQVPEMETWANEQLRQGEEATTCDLAELVMRRLA
jgi:hypothetical protein